jgi:hypothetical protein
MKFVAAAVAAFVGIIVFAVHGALAGLLTFFFALFLIYGILGQIVGTASLLGLIANVLVNRHGYRNADGTQDDDKNYP